MLIGVDFDNTVVCYDDVVHRAAVEGGLVPATVPVSKGAVRDYLRQTGREDAWTELQGYVYGHGIREALPFPGVYEFFSRCAARGVATCVVSHRSRYPVRGARYDLHEAAHGWLTRRGFYDGRRAGLTAERVHFELTREDKLARIGAMGCGLFIDDLPDLLEEPAFPAGVERILFDPARSHQTAPAYHLATSWAEIAQLIA
jgi:hypothetical protein